MTIEAMSITAMRQALEALGKCRYRSLADEIVDPAITALRTAIAEAEKQEPVAWDGYNLDDMCEAFDRVIEEHHQRKNPFHDPVNKDAMIALRVLRGFVPYMKLYTTPPAAQRQPLTDEQVRDLWSWSATAEAERTATTQQHAFARAIEAAHGITGEKT